MTNHPNRARRIAIERREEFEERIHFLEDYIANRDKQIMAAALDIGRMAADRDIYIKALAEQKAKLV